MRIFHWQVFLFLSLACATLVLVFQLPAIPQDISYHDFADRRSCAGIPNFLNVVSSLAFLPVGLAGVQHCLVRERTASRTAWLLFFAGVTLVGAGSAYYHWSPSGATLVWDRLPMTVGFMALCIAILGEVLDSRLVSRLLWPAIALGVYSIVAWYRADDLRLYAWVQFFPLLLVLLALLMTPARWSQRRLLGAALGCYVLAKLAEATDARLFEMSGGMVSGHTLKHLLAAAGCYCVLLMLQRRRPLAW